MIERVRHVLVQGVLVLQLELGVDVVQRLIVKLAPKIGEVGCIYNDLARQLPLERNVQPFVVGLLKVLFIPEKRTILTATHGRSGAFAEDR